MKFYVITLVFLILSCTVQAKDAKDFVFIGWESEPFYHRDPAHGIHGAFHEIMAEICKQQNLSCKFKILPFRDGIETLKKGEAQSMGPMVFTHPRESAFYFSEKLFASTYAFFGKSKDAAKIVTYEDLRGTSVGVMSPSVSKVSLETASEFVDGEIKIVSEKSIMVALKQVENGRYPLAYVNRDAGLKWIETHKSPLVEIGNLGEGLDYRIAFSRASVSEDEFKKINAALITLRKSNFMENLTQKYHLKLSRIENKP